MMKKKSTRMENISTKIKQKKLRKKVEMLTAKIDEKILAIALHKMSLV